MIIKNPVTNQDMKIPDFIVNPRYVPCGLAFMLEFDNDVSSLTDEQMFDPSLKIMLDHTGA